MEEDLTIPHILGQPFLATTRMRTDVQKKLLMLGMRQEKVTFSIFKFTPYPFIKKFTPYPKEELCNQIEVLNIMLVDKGKKTSMNQRQSSILKCFNIRSNHIT